MGQRYTDDSAFGGVTYEARDREAEDAERLRERVRVALVRAGVEVAELDVACVGGDVTLTGSVPDPQQAAAALEAVRKIRGVHAVIDRLRVG